MLDRLLDDARAGDSAALVLCGAAGMGKTALLDYAAGSADGCQIVRAVGIESESELPFAGLHQLCAENLDILERLPAPQRDALATAFGLRSASSAPDRFMIRLGVLSLLSEAAEAMPLLCVVDDAQWLDRTSAAVLSFVARRLKAESVVMLFSVREALEHDDWDQLPDLRVEGLSDAHARKLLASVVAAPRDVRVRERILAEARGNPLALLELSRELPTAPLGDGLAPPGEAVQGRIERSFQRRVQQLPPATQQLLLLAAAEPTGVPELLWRSAAELGISTAAAGPAVEEGMLSLGTRVAFRHSLLRSAIYRAASADDRRAAHRALAAATDVRVDPDRRAWHRGQAVLGPDDEIADELERSAGRARDRGGLAEAAVFRQRAVELTRDPRVRAQRALDAARAKQLAGSAEQALSLLSTAADGPLDDFERATLQRLKGQLALDLRHAGDAVPLLLDSARRLESLDPGLAREVYLETLRAASVAGRLADGRMLEVAQAARNAPPPPGEPRAVDMLLDGLALRFTEGYAASAPALKRALAEVRAADGRDAQDVRWPWTARRVAPDLFDEDTWHALATRNVQLARDAGALAVLPLALNYLSLLCCFKGELAAAGSLLEEADVVAEATRTQRIGFGRVLLAGCRGEEKPGLAQIEASEAAAAERDEGVVLTFGEHARALLYNGLGRHAAALGPARSASGRDELMVSVWALAELVEAAARCGENDIAADAMARLSARTQAAGSDLALGIEARGRALVSHGARIEEFHREAVDRLGRSRLALELARMPSSLRRMAAQAKPPDRRARATAHRT